MTEGKPPRVLIADDEYSIRTLVSRMLTRAGFDPVEASDGQHAIEQLDAGMSMGSCWTSLQRCRASTVSAWWSISSQRSRA
jgi:CheY-like chemotaxis protein